LTQFITDYQLNFGENKNNLVKFALHKIFNFHI
jgi:hypothetical protein